MVEGFAYKQYKKVVRACKVLSAQEESTLFESYNKRKDPQVAEIIIKAHLRLVYFLTIKFFKHKALFHAPIDIDILDYIQEGNSALLRSFELYKSDKETRFSTFAYRNINWSLLRYYLANHSIVNRTQEAHSFYKKNKNQFFIINNEDCIYDGTVVGLDADPLFLLENKIDLKGLLTKTKLKPIEAIVLKKRLLGLSLTEIGLELGMTRQAVEQYEKSAYAKVKKYAKQGDYYLEAHNRNEG